MHSYPIDIRRCQNIKVNGTQCGSPALRDDKYCYYHARWTQEGVEARWRVQKAGALLLPTFEDANSIQVALADVIRLLRLQEVDHRTAALMLYAMQTASANLKHTSFEPEPTQVVIDRECVERRPIGATAWSKVKGREYDQLEKDNAAKSGDAETEMNETKMRSAALRLVLDKFGSNWIDLIEPHEAGEPEEFVER
jgi:hypothetical protein